MQAEWHQSTTDSASFTVRVAMCLKIYIPKYGGFKDIHYDIHNFFIRA